MGLRLPPQVPDKLPLEKHHPHLLASHVAGALGEGQSRCHESKHGVLANHKIKGSGLPFSQFSCQEKYNTKNLVQITVDYKV